MLATGMGDEAGENAISRAQLIASNGELLMDIADMLEHEVE